MTRWNVNRAAAPEIIWDRYEKAIGTEAMQAIFGENWPPTSGRPCEEVYVWRDADANPRPFDANDHPAAWLSLSLDQFDPTTAYMSRGVWPNEHGKGLGRHMRAFAEDWCRERGVTDLMITIHAVNHLHLANVMKDAYWTMEGVFFNPPAFAFSHKIEPI